MAFTNLSTQTSGALVTHTLWNQKVNNWQFIATSAGLLKHEVGGLEIDISGVNDGGILRGTGSGTWAILAAFLDTNGRVKHEYGGIEANISAVTTGGLLEGTGSGSMGVLARGSALQVLRVNSGGSDIEWADPQAGGTAAGTYTGDGSTSLAVTGLGFTPKWVKIWHLTASGHQVYAVETTASIMATTSDKRSVLTYSGNANETSLVDNAIIALSAGSFTVDDAGSDSHPNKASETYHYLAIG